jgi:hypothetical protein
MTREEAIKVLETLPEAYREQALARILEQGAQFESLKALINEALEDIARGRVTDWNLKQFLADLEEEQRVHPLPAPR